MATKNEYYPETITHPGVTLDKKLNEIGMSKKEFALRTEKPEQTIIKVINGTSSITPDMAIQFENALGMPARFWLKRQYQYDEIIARKKRFFTIEKSKDWARCFPYAKMAHFGWVPPTRNINEKVDALFQFFGLSGKTAWENYYFGHKLKVNFRISLKHTSQSYAISAWLRRGENIASNMDSHPYNAKKLKKSLGLIKKIMAKQPDDFFIQLQELCLQAGVKVVFTPCLPKAPIHGSTRWLNDTPLLQLSDRYKQNDIFWFTFFHEIGHILLHGKKYVSIENIDLDEIEHDKEEEADSFAINWTFSEEQEREMLDNAPFNERDIIDFAKKYNTHPGIIIGRFQHKKMLPYSVGRQFIAPINLTN
ncbi:HigA family addiction module antidote protein [Candidatus Pacearchaeota archaeon]|nr:HigA family addiction module antidote protein [Candidatus Pacearchaeota archaeon]